MAETITVYFTPLAFTKIAAYVGLGMASHMGIVYDDGAGRTFGVTSGPSRFDAPQTPSNALGAIFNLATGTPSTFGFLVCDPNNGRPFPLGKPSDYFTHDAEGNTYPHVVVMVGADLSLQWRMIVRSYSEVGRLRLTYSPTSQNSNSLAATALRRAGINVPYSSATAFVPGAFNCLPETEERLRAGLHGECAVP